MQFPADLVTFTEEILNVKIHFLCNVSSKGSVISLSLMNQMILTLTI